MGSRWIRALPVVVLVAGVGAGAAMAASAATHASVTTVRTVESAKYGKVLAGSNGRTVYRFTVDSKGVSKCTGACLSYWPRLLVKPGVKPTAGGGANASLLGTIKAPHGMEQVTYAGYPLYYFAGDSQSGQTKGQGVTGKWYVVNTHGGLVKHAVTTSTSTSTSTSSSSSAWG
jgi:predicted lipoprotein with Yx(FWY)xxD motif